MTTTPANPADQCSNLALRKAARYLGATYDKALAPVGLRATQFSILQQLSAHGEMTITSLADVIAMDRTTMASNLKPLAREGLVTVESSPTDRRARIVAITPEGLSRMNEALPLWGRTSRPGSKRPSAPRTLPACVLRSQSCSTPASRPGPSRRHPAQAESTLTGRAGRRADRISCRGAFTRGCGPAPRPAPVPSSPRPGPPCSGAAEAPAARRTSRSVTARLRAGSPAGRTRPGMCGSRLRTAGSSSGWPLGCTTRSAAGCRWPNWVRWRPGICPTAG